MKQEMLYQQGIHVSRIGDMAPSISTRAWDGEIGTIEALAIGTEHVARDNGVDLEKV
jgi:hypothetical protein